MNINITTRKFELTDAIKDFVNEKVEALSKYSDNITQVRVLLEVDDGHHQHGKVNRSEIVLHSGDISNELVSETWDEDMYASINNTLRVVERELRKSKEKKDSIDRDEIRRMKEEL